MVIEVRIGSITGAIVSTVKSVSVAVDALRAASVTVMTIPDCKPSLNVLVNVMVTSDSSIAITLESNAPTLLATVHFFLKKHFDLRLECVLK